MTFSSFGDLASAFHMRNLSAQMKQDLSRLGQELTTGQKTDISSAVTGDFGPIAAIEHSLKLMDAQDVTINAAKMRTSTVQLALETVQTQLQDLSQGATSAVSSANSTLLETTSSDARQKFSSMLSNMNVQVSGRSVLSGTATDVPPFANDDIVIDALMTAISSETTAGGVSNAIDLWFDQPGGGFESTAYLGSTNNLGDIRLGNGEVAEMPVRADDQIIRDTLKAAAKALVISEGALAGDQSAQTQLMKTASNEMLAANDGMTMLRASVGAVEARIENAQTQMIAERSSLELSRGELIGADPYETATELQAIYGQIESLYSVTARLSQLKFTDYM